MQTPTNAKQSRASRLKRQRLESSQVMSQGDVIWQYPCEDDSPQRKTPRSSPLVGGKNKHTKSANQLLSTPVRIVKRHASSPVLNQNKTSSSELLRFEQQLNGNLGELTEVDDDNSFDLPFDDFDLSQDILLAINGMDKKEAKTSAIKEKLPPKHNDEYFGNSDDDELFSNIPIEQLSQQCSRTNGETKIVALASKAVIIKSIHVERKAQPAQQVPKAKISVPAMKADPATTNGKCLSTSSEPLRSKQPPNGNPVELSKEKENEKKDSDDSFEIPFEDFDLSEDMLVAINEIDKKEAKSNAIKEKPQSKLHDEYFGSSDDDELFSNIPIEQLSQQCSKFAKGANKMVHTVPEPVTIKSNREERKVAIQPAQQPPKVKPSAPLMKPRATTSNAPSTSRICTQEEIAEKRRLALERLEKTRRKDQLNRK